VLTRSPVPANRGAGDENIEFVQGNIADPTAVDGAVAGVDVVFHLAAEKSVQRCEIEPSLAVGTNVVGSWNLLKAAGRARVERIVAASSDKACEPSGILGLTKAVMERVLCSPHDGLACTAVRLGGILESTGSVLDRWARTRTDGFITVTDPEMTRFALSTDEAVALLLAASERSGAGEIVAPALFAYRLGDLAAAYARRHGVEVSIVGRGSGEKSDEQLVSAGEAPCTRREERLFVITPGRRQAGAGPYSSREAPRLEANALLEGMGAERARA
jgi:UDP-glucose 4-epimerase